MNGQKTTNNEKINTILYKLGINKDGSPNGNGLLKKVEDLKENVENMADYIEERKLEEFQLNVRLEKIEEKIKEMQESLKFIESGLKDTINMQSFVKMKNVLIGIVAVLGAFGAIGTFLFKFLKIIYERGN